MPDDLRAQQRGAPFGRVDWITKLVNTLMRVASWPECPVSQVSSMRAAQRATAGLFPSSIAPAAVRARPPSLEVPAQTLHPRRCLTARVRMPRTAKRLLGE